METFLKYLAGGAASLLALLSPIRPLIICALIFIAVDFITGVVASYKRAWTAGEEWGFESRRAWTTVLKLGFVMGGIVMAWMIDAYILEFLDMNLAKIFTGFVCGVEFWSYLENAAEISNHPIFLWLKRFMKKRLNEKLDIHEPETEE